MTDKRRVLGNQAMVARTVMAAFMLGLLFVAALPGGDAEATGMTGISGRKFNDLNGDGIIDRDTGLPNWTIKVFSGAGVGAIEQASTTTDPSGLYQFDLAPGTYIVCEVEQVHWSQTFPHPVDPGVTSCTALNSAQVLAPVGYLVTLPNQVETGLDFANHQAPSTLLPLTDFREVRRPNDITIGPDLGGTGQEALNFIGSTGAAGDTWITVYDPNPPPGPATFGSVSLSADVLNHAYNNKKGAGLLALYNEASGKKGLALTLYDAGNTDTLVLATVDQAGKLVTLKTVSLGAGIVENVWYQVSMDVTVDGGLVSVVGTVFNHQAPTDPNSPLTTQVGVSLTFSATLGAGALVGVEATGEVGILAAAVSAANSSSVANITLGP